MKLVNTGDARSELRMENEKSDVVSANTNISNLFMRVSELLNQGEEILSEITNYVSETSASGVVDRDRVNQFKVELSKYDERARALLSDGKQIGVTNGTFIVLKRKVDSIEEKITQLEKQLKNPAFEKPFGSAVVPLRKAIHPEVVTYIDSSRKDKLLLKNLWAHADFILSVSALVGLGVFIFQTGNIKFENASFISTMTAVALGLISFRVFKFIGSILFPQGHYLIRSVVTMEGEYYDFNPEWLGRILFSSPKTQDIVIGVENDADYKHISYYVNERRESSERYERVRIVKTTPLQKVGRFLFSFFSFKLLGIKPFQWAFFGALAVALIMVNYLTANFFIDSKTDLSGDHNFAFLRLRDHLDFLQTHASYVELKFNSLAFVFTSIWDNILHGRFSGYEEEGYYNITRMVIEALNPFSFLGVVLAALIVRTIFYARKTNIESSLETRPIKSINNIVRAVLKIAPLTLTGVTSAFLYLNGLYVFGTFVAVVAMSLLVSIFSSRLKHVVAGSLVTASLFLGAHWLKHSMKESRIELERISLRVPFLRANPHFTKEMISQINREKDYPTVLPRWLANEIESIFLEHGLVAVGNESKFFSSLNLKNIYKDHPNRRSDILEILRNQIENWVGPVFPKHLTLADRSDFSLTYRNIKISQIYKRILKQKYIEESLEEERFGGRSLMTILSYPEMTAKILNEIDSVINAIDMEWETNGREFFITFVSGNGKEANLKDYINKLLSKIDNADQKTVLFLHYYSLLDPKRGEDLKNRLETVKEKAKAISRKIGALQQRFDAEVIDGVKRIVSENFGNTQMMRELTVGSHHVILIGEENHADPRYSQMKRQLFPFTSDFQIALFLEGLARDNGAEHRFITGVAGLREPSLIFGLEDDFLNALEGTALHFAYLSNDMADQYETTKAQLIYDILVGSKTIQKYWDQLIQNTNPKYKKLVDEIQTYLAQNQTGEITYSFIHDLSKLLSYEDNDQWIELFKDVTHLMIQEANEKGMDASVVEKLLENPRDNSIAKDFVMNWVFRMRNRLFAENFRSVLSELPENIPIVIVVGEGHVDGLIGLLKASEHQEEKEKILDVPIFYQELRRKIEWQFEQMNPKNSQPSESKSELREIRRSELHDQRDKSRDERIQKLMKKLSLPRYRLLFWMPDHYFHFLRNLSALVQNRWNVDLLDKLENMSPNQLARFKYELNYDHFEQKAYVNTLALVMMSGLVLSVMPGLIVMTKFGSLIPAQIRDFFFRVEAGFLIRAIPITIAITFLASTYVAELMIKVNKHQTFPPENVRRFIIDEFLLREGVINVKEADELMNGWRLDFSNINLNSSLDGEKAGVRSELRNGDGVTESESREIEKLIGKLTTENATAQKRAIKTLVKKGEKAILPLLQELEKPKESGFNSEDEIHGRFGTALVPQRNIVQWNKWMVFDDKNIYMSQPAWRKIVGFLVACGVGVTVFASLNFTSRSESFIWFVYTIVGSLLSYKMFVEVFSHPIHTIKMLFFIIKTLPTLTMIAGKKFLTALKFIVTLNFKSLMDLIKNGQGANPWNSFPWNLSHDYLAEGMPLPPKNAIENIIAQILQEHPDLIEKLLIRFNAHQFDLFSDIVLKNAKQIISAPITGLQGVYQDIPLDKLVSIGGKYRFEPPDLPSLPTTSVSINNKYFVVPLPTRVATALGKRRTLFEPTFNPRVLASQVMNQFRLVEDQLEEGGHDVGELQLSVGFDTGYSKYSDRGKFVALALYVLSTDDNNFQALDHIPQTERDSGAAFGLLIRGINVQNVRPHQKEKHRLDYVFPVSYKMKEENLNRLISILKFLNLGLLLTTAQDEWQDLYGSQEQPPAWTPQKEAIAHAYRKFEREIVRLLRRYDNYRNPEDIYNTGDAKDHAERTHAFLNFRLEQALEPNRKWVTDLEKFDSKKDQNWEELLPYLRGVEGMILNNKYAEEENGARGVVFVREVRGLLVDVAGQIEDIVTGKQVQNAGSSEKASKDPFIDSGNPEETREYAERMAEVVKAGQIPQKYLPDWNAVRFYAPSSRSSDANSQKSELRVQYRIGKFDFSLPFIAPQNTPVKTPRKEPIKIPRPNAPPVKPEPPAIPIPAPAPSKPEPVPAGRSELRVRHSKPPSPESIARSYQERGYFATLELFDLTLRGYHRIMSGYVASHGARPVDYFALTYDEARQVIQRPRARKPYGVLNSKQTAQNLILATLDTIHGFKLARERNDIKRMADLYRRHVIEYKPKNRKKYEYDSQLTFFREVGGLNGLMTNRYPFLSRKLSPGALLRLVLPELIDVRNPDALGPLEVERSYWTESENAKYHILLALDAVPGFRKARKRNDVKTMANLYRKYVNGYKPKDKEKFPSNGQLAFFYERGGLLTLLSHPRPYFRRRESPAELLRIAIPELVNTANPDALKPQEIETARSKLRQSGILNASRALESGARSELRKSIARMKALIPPMTAEGLEKVDGFLNVDSKASHQQHASTQDIDRLIIFAICPELGMRLPDIVSQAVQAIAGRSKMRVVVFVRTSLQGEAMKALFPAEFQSKIESGEILITSRMNESQILRGAKRAELRAVGLPEDEPFADRLQKYFPNNIQVVKQIAPENKILSVFGQFVDTLRSELRAKFIQSIAA